MASLLTKIITCRSFAGRIKHLRYKSTIRADEPIVAAEPMPRWAHDMANEMKTMVKKTWVLVVSLVGINIAAIGVSLSTLDSVSHGLRDKVEGQNARIEGQNAKIDGQTVKMDSL